MLKKNSKTKKIVKAIFQAIVITLVAVQYFFGRGDLTNGCWILDFHKVYITIASIGILYAIFLLWVDDFFKKNWKERDYYPLVGIALAVWALYALISTQKMIAEVLMMSQ